MSKCDQISKFPVFSESVKMFVIDLLIQRNKLACDNNISFKLKTQIYAILTSYKLTNFTNPPFEAVRTNTGKHGQTVNDTNTTITAWIRVTGIPCRNENNVDFNSSY